MQLGFRVWMHASTRTVRIAGRNDFTMKKILVTVCGVVLLIVGMLCGSLYPVSNTIKSQKPRIDSTQVLFDKFIRSYRDCEAKDDAVTAYDTQLMVLGLLGSAMRKTSFAVHDSDTMLIFTTHVRIYENAILEILAYYTNRSIQGRDRRVNSVIVGSAAIDFYRIKKNSQSTYEAALLAMKDKKLRDDIDGIVSKLSY